jgi:hypothetical protein
MTRSARTNYLLAALLIVGGLLLADRIFSFYLETRESLLNQRDTEEKNLADAKATLVKQKQLQDLIKRMGPSLSADASAVEGQMLHLVNDWESKAGATDVSCQRIRTDSQHGFTRLTFQLSATGGMPSVASLLYEVESAPIPLRIESLQLRPRTDKSEDLSIDLTVSTPCNGKAALAAEPHIAASASTPDANVEGSHG